MKPPKKLYKKEPKNTQNRTIVGGLLRTLVDLNGVTKGQQERPRCHVVYNRLTVANVAAAETQTHMPI